MLSEYATCRTEQHERLQLLSVPSTRIYGARLLFFGSARTNKDIIIISYYCVLVQLLRHYTEGSRQGQAMRAFCRSLRAAFDSRLRAYFPEFPRARFSAHMHGQKKTWPPNSKANVLVRV